MRDPERITEFMHRLHDIWKQECPDWRFGQLIFNVFNQLDFDPFMMEDNQMLYEFERYFNLVDESEDPIAVHKDLLISHTYRHKKEKPKIYNYEERLITRTTINEEGGLKIYDRKRSNNRRATRIIKKDNDRTKTNRKKESRRRTKHKDSI